MAGDVDVKVLMDDGLRRAMGGWCAKQKDLEKDEG